MNYTGLAAEYALELEKAASGKIKVGGCTIYTKNGEVVILYPDGTEKLLIDVETNPKMSDSCIIKMEMNK